MLGMNGLSINCKVFKRGNDYYELQKYELQKFTTFLHQIPKLSWPYLVFKDFSGPEKIS